MKFVCESCSARYRIDDGRVQGKVLKIRCKKCGHIIEVRSQEATPSATSATEWHVSVNGVPRGPLTEQELMESFRSGAIGDEAYVWNSSFDAWKAALDVPAFSGALQAAKQAGLRAQHPTTQRLDAVELDRAMAGKSSDDVAARVSKKLQALRAEVESGSRAAATDTTQAKPTLAPKPEPPATGDAAVAAAAAEAPNPKRPGRPSGPAASVASKAVPKPDRNTPTTLGDDAQGGAADATQPTEAKTTDAVKAALAPPMETAGPGVPDEPATPVLPLAATPMGGQVAVGSVSGAAPDTTPVPVAVDEPAKTQPPATPSNASVGDGKTTRNRVTTAQPASLPTAALQANQDPSASLLFQVRQAKAARNRAIAIAVFALLAMIVTAFAWSSRPAPEAVVTNEPTVAEPIVRTEVTPEALAALAQGRRVALVRAERIVHDALENGELAITPVVPANPSSNTVALGGARNVAPSGSATGSQAPRIDHVQTSTNVTTDRDNRGRTVTRVASLDSLGSAAEVERAAIDPSGIEMGQEGFFGAVGQTGSAVAPELSAPELQARRPGPSPELFAPGLRSFVSESVERCTQRQLMETGSIPQARVVLSITVQNTGEVSRVQADRGSRDTPFERCLQSHRGRWDFPAFNGDSQTLQRTYLLQ